VASTIFLPQVGAQALTGGSKVWTAGYNGPDAGQDLGRRAVTSPDGSRIFVTGSSSATDTGNDLATVALDAGTGQRSWAARYDGPASLNEDAVDIAISPDGSAVFVTGSSEGTSTARDFVTVGYDASSGTKLWAKRFDGAAHDVDDPSAVRVSPDGALVFVVGTSLGSLSTGSDIRTIAYDASTGAVQWSKRHNGTLDNDDSAFSLAVSPDGSSVIAIGTSFNSTGGDYATISYNAASGATNWVKAYNGYVSNSYDEAHAVVINPAGTRAFVTGYIGLGPPETPSGGTLTMDYATVAYRLATGKQVWDRLYDGPTHGNDQASALAISPDGSMVFATGVLCPQGQCTGALNEWATVAYRAGTGERVWVRRFNGPGESFDIAMAVAVSPSSSTVYVTGDTTANGASYAKTIAYGATDGATIWSTRFGPAQAGDVDPSVDGSLVFVTGTRYRPSGTDYVTVALAA
jgi:PQQ-like domain